MTYDPMRHHRRSIRLRGYDYRRCGVYFVTLCTRDRECLFGHVRDGAMRLNDAGHIVLNTWNQLPAHYAHVALDEMQVMPNHLHGNLVIVRRDARHALGEIVRGLKTFSALAINHVRASPGVPVWQRGYYDRVIRNDDELTRSREYIRNNPLHWNHDPDHP